MRMLGLPQAGPDTTSQSRRRRSRGILTISWPALRRPLTRRTSWKTLRRTRPRRHHRGPTVRTVSGSQSTRVTKRVTFEVITGDNHHPTISAELVRFLDSPYYRGLSVVEKIHWSKAQTEKERRVVDKIIQVRAERLADVLNQTWSDPSKCWNYGFNQH